MRRRRVVRRAIGRAHRRGRRRARPTTASSTRACSTTARSRRNSGRAPRPPGSRSGSRRRAPPSSFGMQIASSPSRMHVAEILDREASPRDRAWRRAAPARARRTPRLADQLRLSLGQPERLGREIGASVSRTSVAFIDVSLHAAMRTASRKSRTAASKARRRFQVREMADAGQADIARARDLRRHPLHHRGRRVAVVLAGEAENRHADVRADWRARRT